MYSKKLFFIAIISSLIIPAPLMSQSTILEVIQAQKKSPLSIQGRLLNMAHKGITSLQGVEQISNIEKVWSLTVSGNEVDVIKANTFNHPQLKNLVALDLSKNNISTIERGGLNGLESLNFLWLNNNKITSLAPGALEGLTKNKQLFIFVGNNPGGKKLQEQIQKELPRAHVYLVTLNKEALRKAALVAGIAIVIIGVVIAGMKYQAAQKAQAETAAQAAAQRAQEEAAQRPQEEAEAAELVRLGEFEPSAQTEKLSSQERKKRWEAKAAAQAAAQRAQEEAAQRAQEEAYAGMRSMFGQAEMEEKQIAERQAELVELEKKKLVTGMPEETKGQLAAQKQQEETALEKYPLWPKTQEEAVARGREVEIEVLLDMAGIDNDSEREKIKNDILQNPTFSPEAQFLVYTKGQSLPEGLQKHAFIAVAKPRFEEWLQGRATLQFRQDRLATEAALFNEPENVRTSLKELFMNAYPGDLAVKWFFEVLDRKRDSDIIPLLMKFCNVNAAFNVDYRWTPLHLAVNGNNKDLVNKLLGVPGIDINRADRLGRTPLILAVIYNHEAIVNRLLAARANVNAADGTMHTPLHMAVIFNNAPLVHTLLINGAFVDRANSLGQTPLLMAVVRGNNRIVARLLNAGADANQVDNHGNTLLQTAIIKNNTQIVETLLNAGAEANQVNNLGLTPLALAQDPNTVRNPATRRKIIALLKKHGAR